MAAEYYRPDREAGPDGLRPARDAPATSAAAPATARSATRPAALGVPARRRPAGRAAGERPRPRRRCRPGSTGSPAPPTSPRRSTLLGDHPDADAWSPGRPTGASRSTCAGAGPSYVVAVDRLPELRAVSTDGPIEIGAALTLSEVEAALGDAVPLLAEVWPLFASPLIRNGATIGGNLAHRVADRRPARRPCSPSTRRSCSPPPTGTGRSRWPTSSPATARPCCAPGELVRAVRVPTPLAAHTALPQDRQAALRRHLQRRRRGFALDVVDGTVVRARIGLGGVAATPIRAPVPPRPRSRARPWTQDDGRGGGPGAGAGGHADRRPARQCRLPLGDARQRPAGWWARRTGAAMSHLSERPDDAVVGLALPHESAALHVTGHALYTDDLVHRTHARPARPPGLLAPRRTPGSPGSTPPRRSPSPGSSGC